MWSHTYQHSNLTYTVYEGNCQTSTHIGRMDKKLLITSCKPREPHGIMTNPRQGTQMCLMWKRHVCFLVFLVLHPISQRALEGQCTLISAIELHAVTPTCLILSRMTVHIHSRLHQVQTNMSLTSDPSAHHTLIANLQSSLAVFALDTA